MSTKQQEQHKNNTTIIIILIKEIIHSSLYRKDVNIEDSH